MIEYPKALYKGESDTAVAKDAEQEAKLLAEGFRLSLLPEVAQVESEEAVVVRRGRPRKVEED